MNHRLCRVTVYKPTLTAVVRDSHQHGDYFHARLGEPLALGQNHMTKALLVRTTGNWGYPLGEIPRRVALALVSRGYKSCDLQMRIENRGRTDGSTWYEVGFSANDGTDLRAIVYGVRAKDRAATEGHRAERQVGLF